MREGSASIENESGRAFCNEGGRKRGAKKSSGTPRETFRTPEAYRARGTKNNLGSGGTDNGTRSCLKRVGNCTKRGADCLKKTREGEGLDEKDMIVAEELRNPGSQKKKKKRKNSGNRLRRKDQKREEIRPEKIVTRLGIGGGRLYNSGTIRDQL